MISGPYMALDENSWLCEIGLDLLKMKMHDGDLRLLRHGATQIRLNGMKWNLFVTDPPDLREISTQPTSTNFVILQGGPSRQMSGSVFSP